MAKKKKLTEKEMKDITEKRIKQDMMASYLDAMRARRERGENPDTKDRLGRDPSEKIDGSNITADDIRIHGLEYASRLVNTPLTKIEDTEEGKKSISKKKQSRKYHNNKYTEGE